MSGSTGQKIGYAVGAVVGYFIGDYYDASLLASAALGASIGGAVGAAIDPPKGPKLTGPRLADLSQQTASYGTDIPRVYGSTALFGNVFWIENNKLKETSTTTGGGKGGGSKPQTTTYRYSATFALGLCRGPISGIRRIWVTGKLIYDAGSDDLATIKSSNLAASGFTLYTGSETQSADPRMQATLGVANTPAFRGLAYIVFEDFDLTNYGNTLAGAQIKVEVVKDGAIGDTVVKTTLSGSTYGINASDGILTTVILSNGSAALYSLDGGINYISTTLPSGFSVSDVAYGNGRFVAAGRDGSNFASAWSLDGKTWFSGGTLSNLYDCITFDGTRFVAVGKFNRNVAVSVDGKIWTVIPSVLSLNYWTKVAFDGTNYVAVAYDTNSIAYSPDLLSWSYSVLPGYHYWSDVISENGIFMACQLNPGVIAISLDHGVTWSEVNSTVYGAKQLTFGDGIFIASGDASSYYSSDNGSNWTKLTSFSPSGDVCWNGAWFIFSLGVNTLWRYRRRKLTVGTTTLDSIIESELLLSNLLTVGDIDVSSLTDTVRGYRISSTAAIRSGIDPLQAAWPFDIIQDGYKVKFIRRGSSASVATIYESELDARRAGEAPGIRLTKSREMNTQLPWQVTLKYLDISREYDTNAQSAQRQNTDSANIQTSELPIVLSADEAAQKAEILLYLYWLERYDVSLTLPPSYNGLQPADIITVETSDAIYLLRLTGINYTSDNRLECSAKLSDSATYTSTATADTGYTPTGNIALHGPSEYALLDIPTLKDSYDTAGFPVAMCGRIDGWSSGTVFRSLDGAQTWSALNSFSVPSTIGYAFSALGVPNDTRMIDGKNTLQVRLYQGELSSISEALMLNGGNHFALGEDGRWEIIAARTVALQADGSYILSDLLRGRFGTEWACSTHAVGDRIVLLSEVGLQFANASLNQIGVSAIYRGISGGDDLGSDSDLDFTYQGVNLECLSPVYLNGSRHPTTNDWSLSWIRRTRVGGEWRNYVDASLGETAESYEVDIYTSGSYTTLKRTLSGLTSSAASYTSAQQVADFGSNQSTLYIKVYQLSANVGRGYPLTTSITR